MIRTPDPCLFRAMINHLQVAVQVAKMPLSKITQNVLFRNARLINRENRRIAHLFAG